MPGEHARTHSPWFVKGAGPYGSEGADGDHTWQRRRVGPAARCVVSGRGHNDHSRVVKVLHGLTELGHVLDGVATKRQVDDVGALGHREQRFEREGEVVFADVAVTRRGGLARTRGTTERSSG